MEELKIEISKDRSDIFESCLKDCDCKILSKVPFTNPVFYKHMYLYTLETDNSVNYFHLGRLYGSKTIVKP